MHLQVCEAVLDAESTSMTFCYSSSLRRSLPDFFFLSLHKVPWVLQDLETGFIKGLLLRASQNSDIVIRHSSGFEYKLSPWLQSLCALHTYLDWRISGISALTNAGCRA